VFREESGFERQLETDVETQKRAVRPLLEVRLRILKLSDRALQKVLQRCRA
jgi:hypothetical protein